MSHRVIPSILKPPYHSILYADALHDLPLRRLRPSHPTRHASSSPPTTSKAANKPIVLEPPDKFRPPSHPARLNARRMPRQYPGPPIPKAEKEAQATRKYPNTFPNEGTRMFWFLTHRTLHLWISLGTLFFLSIITLTQSFLHTSPFAHLSPSLSTLPIAPLAFFRDWFSVIQLHQQYTSERSAEKRRQGIEDAQKRRLYRRAHGLEDLDRDVQGVDVRGLVSWDDGLSNQERERLVLEALRARFKGVDDGCPVNQEDEEERMLGREVERDKALEEQQQQQQRKRPVKKWLGIW